jgi:tRNA A-37 threonylcarbamoyl transferase component Bud32
MSLSLDDWRDDLIVLSLATPEEARAAQFQPLAGGVSSDIILAHVYGRQICLKRALGRLKVAQIWEAPLSRNKAEANYLETVGAWFPGCVPKLLARNDERGVFAMEFLAPAQHSVWKAELLAGKVDVQFAGEVGRLIGAIHRKSQNDVLLAQRFAFDENFEALRLAPYLRATALIHKDLAEKLHILAQRIASHQVALVHGDVSPKNILCGPNGPVLLDAECAWFGDPAFDLAFCLNHLLLKAVHLPHNYMALLHAYEALIAGYGVEMPDPDIQHRCAALLPALLLARVDGKSPVEYLDNSQRDVVRQHARGLLMRDALSLADICHSMVLS